MSSTARLPLVLLVLAAVTACASPRTYEPDTTLVARLGQEDAVSRLRTLVGVATHPPVHNVEVSEGALAFEWMRTGHDSRIRFSRIESVDIGRGEHAVTIRMQHHPVPYRFVFTRGRDAQEFVDLLASFHRESQGVAAAPLRVTRDSERP